MGKIKNTYRMLVYWWLGVIRTHPVISILSALLVSALSLYYTVNHLKIDANTNNMIAEDVEYRKNWDNFRKSFEGGSFEGEAKKIIVVIDGQNQDKTTSKSAVKAAAAILYKELKNNQKLFGEVFWPAGDRFFKQNGLLYLNEDELQATLDEIISAQPFITSLANDMSLRGLFGILSDGLLGIKSGAASEISTNRFTAFMEGISGTIEAHISREPHTEKPRAEKPNELQVTGLTGGLIDNRHLKNTQIITVIPTKLTQDKIFGATAIKEIRQIIKEHGLNDGENGVRIGLTGEIPLKYDELKDVASSSKIAAIVSLVLVSCILIAGKNSYKLVLTSIFTLIIGLIWAAGFVTLVIGHLNLISVAFAVLFIGLGIDFGIHFTLRYQEFIKDNAKKASALGKTIRRQIAPLTLTAIAAAIGFFSFVGSDFTGLSELGIIAGCSMFIALFATFTIQTAVLSLVSVKPHETSGKIQKLSQDIETSLRAHSRKIIWGAIILFTLGVTQLENVRFNFDPIHLKNQNSESVRTLAILKQNSNIPVDAVYAIADDMEHAREIKRKLIKLPFVAKVRTIADYVPKRQASKLAAIEDAAILFTPLFLPQVNNKSLSDQERKEVINKLYSDLQNFITNADRQENSAAYTAATRLSGNLKSLAEYAKQNPGTLAKVEADLIKNFPEIISDVRNMLSAEKVTIDNLPAFIKKQEITGYDRFRVTIFPKINTRNHKEMEKFASVVQNIVPEATGGPIITYNAGQVVSDAMTRSTLIAFLVISLMLYLILQRFIYVFLSVIPLILASVLTLASAAILGLEFNFANVIVLPLLIGLGIASGLHLVMRQRAAEKAKSNSDAQLLISTSTPRAVLLSAFTTIGSFGTLAISNHQGTASMGELLTLAISLTLICTLVLLPPLLKIFSKV